MRKHSWTGARQDTDSQAASRSWTARGARRLAVLVGAGAVTRGAVTLAYAAASPAACAERARYGVDAAIRPARAGALALAVCLVVLAPASARADCTPGPADDGGVVVVTCGFTGGEQTFTVPAGTTELHVVATGGASDGVLGATASATLGVAASGPVQPGSTLYVEVGGATSYLNRTSAGGLTAAGAAAMPCTLSGPAVRARRMSARARA